MQAPELESKATSNEKDEGQAHGSRQLTQPTAPTAVLPQGPLLGRCMRAQAPNQPSNGTFDLLYLAFTQARLGERGGRFGWGVKIPLGGR